MKKYLKITIGIIFTILPIGFSFIDSFNYLDTLKSKKILGENFKIDSLVSFLAIGIPIMYIGLNSIISDIKNNKLSTLTESLLEMTKEYFYNLLREICKDSELPPNIKLPFRIYKPVYSDYSILNKIYKLSSTRKPIKFIAVSLDGKPISGKSQFYVEKTKRMKLDVPQGIVGKSYKDDDLIVDDNLNENSVIYNLTPDQNDKVGDLHFALSYPLRDHNGKITHIVTFDSKQKLNVPDDDQQFKNIVKEYILKVNNRFPHLFT